MELNKHLKMYRSAPHPTTGKSPAELLFARRFRTKLPDIRHNTAKGRQEIEEAREQDRKEKAKQKMYKDGKAAVRPNNIKEGDSILLERKSTKADSPYDPQPYTAEAVHGTQVVGRRGEERKVRDSQRRKRIQTRPSQQFGRAERKGEEDADVGLPATYASTATRGETGPRLKTGTGDRGEGKTATGEAE